MPDSSQPPSLPTARVTRLRKTRKAAAHRRENYSLIYWLAVLVALLTLVVTGLMGSADGLGLSRAHVIILGIVLGALGLLQTQLPRITKPPSDDRKGLD